MSYIGDFALGQTFDTKFTTRQISGAPFTLGSTPVISAYVGNSTTEITAGITLSVDFDSRTGLNNVRVVATGGNGYATATDYQLVITTGTVNSVSVVGEVIAEFSIENRQSNVKFWNGTAVATPATAGIPDVNVKNINNVAAATPGAAGGLFIAGTNAATTVTGSLTTTFTGNLTGSVASVTGAVGSVTGAVGSVTGAVGSVTGNVGGNVTGSVGSVTGLTASDVGAIKAKTDNLPASPAAVGSAMTLTAAYDFAKGTTAVTEAYAANGVAPTPVQAILAIHQMLMDFAISGTNYTVKKLDNSTTAFVVTLDSAVTPTSAVRT